MDPLDTPGRSPATPRQEDPRSFSERYAAQEPRASLTGIDAFGPSLAAAPAGRHAAPLVAIALGVVFLALGGLTAATVLVSSTPPAADRPALVPRYAVTSPRPSGSAATPSPRPSASVRPSESALESNSGSPPSGAGPVRLLRGREAVIAKLVKEMSRTESVRIEVSGGATAVGRSMAITATYEVSGSDFSGILEFSGNLLGQRARTEMVLKDGVMYGRVVGGAWTRRVLSAEEDEAFSGTLKERDLAFLAYDGVVRQGGQRLHVLPMVELDWPALLEGMLPSDKMTVQDLELEMLVNDRGQIISESLEARMRVDEGGHEMNMTLDFSYSHFGEPVRIEAPDIESDTPAG